MVQYSPKYASQIIGIIALICLSSFTLQPPKSKSKSFKEIQIIAYAWEIGEKKDYLHSKFYAYMDSTGRCQILKLQKGIQPSYQAFSYTLTPKEFGELSESIEQLQSDTTLAATGNGMKDISKRFYIKKSSGQAVQVQLVSPIQRTIYESIYAKIDSTTNISRIWNRSASSQLQRMMRSKAREIYRLEHAKHIKRHKIPFEGCILINPIEKMPEFPGGNDSIFCFIEARLKQTRINSTNAKGRVYASFRITKEGNVEDIRIISRLYTDSSENFTKDSVIQNDITRVIKQFPRWKPAEQDGQKVNSGYTIPISIPYIISKCRCINDTSFVMMPDTTPNFIYGSKPTLSERIYDYVRENIHMIDDDIQGTIYVRATVDKNGSLKDLTLVNDLDPYYNNEALRLVKDMPRWEPAVKKGRPVKTAILIPIKILMQ